MSLPTFTNRGQNRYENPFQYLRKSSPVASNGLRPNLESAFLELFNTAAETENEDEMRWAHEELKKLYRDAYLNDRAPSLFDAMRWAAALINDREDAGLTADSGLYAPEVQPNA